jgi:hypothetical protein
MNGMHGALRSIVCHRKKRSGTRFPEQIGTDGLQLLQLLDVEKEWAWLREIPAVQILRRVWIQQFYASDPGSPVRLPCGGGSPPCPTVDQFSL